ncbi:MAG: aminotransferase class I/II-fold pyridoxal phosphate-dependent enzyme, partial [Nitrospira sp.]
MFQQRLNDLAQQSLLRQLRTIASASGPEVTLAGRPVILMASNDYLGLAAHPALKQAAIDATERFGVGAGAARLISGTLPPHTELEAALAKFKGTEAALTFGSGYLAN